MADDKGKKGEGGAPKAPKPAAMEQIDGQIKLISEEQIARQEEFNTLKKEELELRRTIAAANIENNVLEGEMYLRMGSMKNAAEAYERAKKRQVELSQQLELSINSGAELEAKIAAATEALKDKATKKNKEALDALLEQKQAIEENRTAVDEELRSHEERVKALEDA